MHVTAVRPSELGSSEAGEWQKFQQSSPIASNPFFSLGYTQARGRAEANARIAVVEDYGKIQAFIPYEVGDDNIATTLGGSETALDGLVTSNVPIDVRSVISNVSLRGWRFSRAPAEQRSLDPHRYQGGHHWTTVPFIDLSSGYDKYIQGLDDGVIKRISRTARYKRALQREMGTVSFEWNTANPEHLTQLLEWKSIQYNQAREWFSNPKALAVIRDVASMDNEYCRGVLGVLSAGPQTVAIMLSLQAPGTLAPWIMAYDSQFGRFSPGTIHLLALIEDATRHGVARIDLGYDLGQMGVYKARFSNCSYQVSGGGVWASRAEAAARSFYRRLRYRDLFEGPGGSPAPAKSG
jgi:CelD/BcsL family acetyltransferase involved in cellulose biosynthesis